MSRTVTFHMCKILAFFKILNIFLQVLTTPHVKKGINQENHKIFNTNKFLTLFILTLLLFLSC
jgi:hypothetical protein